MTRQVRSIVRALEDVAERVVQKITLDVTANLIETTPVDTGWARANWVPKIGAAVEDVVGKPNAIVRGPQQSGIATVAFSYRLAQGAVFVSNNVPYILKLNDGHSKQAPAMFVERAIQKAVTKDILGL